MPRCPPASPDWATIASTPSRSSSTASATVVAVPRTTLPASLICSKGRTPNVKLNTGTRSSATTASCASTSPGGGADRASCGSGRPSSARSGARTACIAATRSVSASGGGSGAKRLTAERTVCQTADRGDRVPQLVRPERRAPERAESTRVGDGCHELGRREATGHGSLDDRIARPEKLGGPGVEAAQRSAAGAERSRHDDVRVDDRRQVAARAGRSRGSARGGSPRSRRPVRGR